MSVRRRCLRGFSLIELLVVTGLFSITLIGLLAAFDSAGRINKTELQSSELQQSLRAALQEIQRDVRMAGVGDLSVTQAVVVADPVSGASYNNVATGYSLADINGGPAHPVRAGTDVIEIRGVLTTPLFALTAAGCGDCAGASEAVVIPAVTRYGVANDDAGQFSILQGALSGPGQRLFVVSSQEVSSGPGGGFFNVGLATAFATGAAPPRAIVTADFTHADARKFNGTVPYGGAAPNPLDTNVRGGMLDDILYFVDDSDPEHPALATAILRSVSPRLFEILPIATDIEDMQFAYGIDGIDGTPLDGSISNTFSTTAGADEWQPNVKTEAVAAPATFFAAAGPRLRSVMVSIVSKAARPDVAYRGRPNASGVFPLDSAAAPVSSAAINRKTMTIRINLRNFNRGA